MRAIQGEEMYAAAVTCVVFVNFFVFAPPGPSQPQATIFVIFTVTLGRGVLPVIFSVRVRAEIRF